MRPSLHYGVQLSGRMMTANYRSYDRDLITYRWSHCISRTSASHMSAGPVIGGGLRSERHGLIVSFQMNLIAYASGTWSRIDDKNGTETPGESIEKEGTFSEVISPGQLLDSKLLLNDISLTYRYVFGARGNR